jgi:hypothetical protein
MEKLLGLDKDRRAPRTAQRHPRADAGDAHPAEDNRRAMPDQVGEAIRSHVESDSDARPVCTEEIPVGSKRRRKRGAQSISGKMLDPNAAPLRRWSTSL